VNDTRGQVQPSTGIGAGLSILACFDDQARRSRQALVRLTGLAAATVDEQLAKLTMYGYLEEMTGRHYRLSRQTLGGSEITATSLHNTQTRPRRQAHDDDGDTGAAA
jgi:DNA-binding IclR family transcriptional regulator